MGKETGPSRVSPALPRKQIRLSEPDSGIQDGATATLSGQATITACSEKQPGPSCFLSLSLSTGDILLCFPLLAEIQREGAEGKSGGDLEKGQLCSKQLALNTPQSAHLGTELLSLAGTVARSQGFPAMGRYRRFNPLRESCCYYHLLRFAKDLWFWWAWRTLLLMTVGD